MFKNIFSSDLNVDIKAFIGSQPYEMKKIKDKILFESDKPE